MDPTIEALTIHSAAWAALLQGLAEGVAWGVAVVASVPVVTVVAIACLGGRQAAGDGEDQTTEPADGAPSSLSGIVPTVWAAGRTHGVRRRRRVCQRATRGWAVIARRPESVG